MAYSAKIMEGKVTDIPAKTCMTWQLKTNRFKALGMYKGDTIMLDEEGWQQNGAWIIICFSGKYYIRELHLFPGQFRLLPLEGKLQPIDWPMYKPLPIVGRIMSIHRQLNHEND